MNRAFIGIDPGKSGAIACIYDNKVNMLPMPVEGKEIVVGHIINWLESIYYSFDSVSLLNDWSMKNWYVAYIEKVGAMPKQGVVSMFNFGFNTGILHGVFRTLGIPLYTVTPQAWKKEILAGTDKSKQASIDYVLRAYPDVKLFRTERSRTYDHNMAEALCIAEYAKRKHS